MMIQHLPGLLLNYLMNTFSLSVKCTDLLAALQEADIKLQILQRFGMLLDVAEAEDHVITRQVYANARSQTRISHPTCHHCHPPPYSLGFRVQGLGLRHVAARSHKDPKAAILKE